MKACLRRKCFRKLSSSSGSFSGHRRSKMATHMSRCRTWSRVQRYCTFKNKCSGIVAGLDLNKTTGALCIFNATYLPDMNSVTTFLRPHQQRLAHSVSMMLTVSCQTSCGLAVRMA